MHICFKYIYIYTFKFQIIGELQKIIDVKQSAHGTKGKVMGTKDEEIERLNKELGRVIKEKNEEIERLKNMVDREREAKVRARARIRICTFISSLRTCTTRISSCEDMVFFLFFFCLVYLVFVILCDIKYDALQIPPKHPAKVIDKVMINSQSESKQKNPLSSVVKSASIH